LDSIWWLIALVQFPNAIAFIFDGILFGHREFRYLRNAMAMGFVFIIIPFYASALHFDSLLFIWLGFSVLNLWRIATGFHRTKLSLQ
jgi:Na+-driven multidrug efflux pump